MLVLFWLVWYVTGPVCETFDYWDPPRQELHDVLFYGGGGITLVAVGFAISIALFHKLRERCACPPQAGRISVRPPATLPADLVNLLLLPAAFIHPPPALLRI